MQAVLSLWLQLVASVSSFLATCRGGRPTSRCVSAGARNGSRSHSGRAVLPDTTSAVVAAAGGVTAAASLPASVAKQQLYQQVLAGQVQAQLVPAALKLPLLLPNDERRHRPQQAQLKVPGGSLPT